MTVFVGGVGELYQGDLDLGRRAADRLATEQLGAHVLVEELHYGAVAVAQRLQEVGADTLVLVGAVVRGRALGGVSRRRVQAADLPAEHLHAAVRDAVTGYVGIDLVIEVAAAFGALPRRTVAIEVEPAATGVSLDLTPAGEAALEEALALVRAEVRRAPLLRLAADLTPLVERLRTTPAVAALRALLEQLTGLDVDGRWGSTYAWRDRARLAIAEGAVGEDMDRLDWSLWWALLEELDRLEPLEATAP